MKTRLHYLPLLLAASLLFTTVNSHAQLSLEWLTQYGSSEADAGVRVAVDTSGQTWVAGSTQGSLGGPYAGGISDIILSRISPTGNVELTLHAGGSNTDSAWGLSLVGSGTVFIAGETNSPSLNGQTSQGSWDAFFLRYDTSGTLLGTTLFGDSASNNAYASAGNTTHLFIGGATKGGFDGQTTVASSEDAFLTKRDSAGSLVWTRFLGTNSIDQAWGVALDPVGNSYVCGLTYGSFPGFTAAGGGDIFLARYDPAGNRTLLRQFGVNNLDQPTDIELDLAGNIYLCGDTFGNLGGQTNAGSGDAFVMKLDASGTVLWTRLLGGAGSDIARSLDIGSDGRVYLTGQSNGAIAGHINAGGYDGFLAQFETNGVLLDTEFFASAGQDTVAGVDVGLDGGVYVTGLTDGTLGAASFGGRDIFVAKFAVPEPTTGALLLAGLACPLTLRRHRRRNSPTCVPLPFDATPKMRTARE